MARYGCTITVDTGKIPSSQSNFSWLATEVNFPTAAIDGGVTSILNGGGNLRCYTDNTKITQLPIEVVTFVTGLTPSVQVWGLSPTLGDSGTVYIEADTVATTQPPVTGTYGRNNVWVDFESVIHASETGTNGVFVDSTGNGHDTTLTRGATLGTTSANHPFGGTWPDYDTTQDITLTNSASLIDNSDFTLSTWYYPDVVSSSRGLFGNRRVPTDWAQINSDGRIFTDSAGVVNKIDGSNSINNLYNIKLKASETLLERSVNGVTNGSLVTVDGTSIVSSEPFVVGSYNDTLTFDGKACEYRIKRAFDSADLDEAEYNNQSDPATFWITGAWEDQDAGSGINVNAESQGYSVSFYDAAVDFAGEVLVSAESQLFSVSFYDAQIELVVGLNVIAESQLLNVNFYDADVQFFGDINIQAESQSYSVTFYDANVSIADVWTDKPLVSTDWSNQSKVTTIWTDK